ncbi:hypothetical protein ScalyP_jg2381 [Parmales sp. scaly parma]|nr:hypothetical protein ScalyP_jg2381 [Parmales sp. scaly parma]
MMRKSNVIDNKFRPPFRVRAKKPVDKNSTLSPFELSLLKATKTANSNSKTKLKARKESKPKPVLVTAQRNIQLEQQRQKMIASTIGGLRIDNAQSTVTINTDTDNHLASLEKLISLSQDHTSNSKSHSNSNNKNKICSNSPTKAGLNRWTEYSAMGGDGTSNSNENTITFKSKDSSDHKFFDFLVKSPHKKEVIKATALVNSGGGKELEELMQQATMLTNKKMDLIDYIKKLKVERGEIESRIKVIAKHGGSSKNIKSRSSNASRDELSFTTRDSTTRGGGIRENDSSVASGVTFSGGENKERKRKVLRNFLFGGSGVGSVRARTSSACSNNSQKSSNGSVSVNISSIAHEDEDEDLDEDEDENLLDERLVQTTEEVNILNAQKQRAAEHIKVTSRSVAASRVRRKNEIEDDHEGDDKSNKLSGG